MPWRARSRLPKSAANSGALTRFKPPDDRWGQYLGRKISIRYVLHGDPGHPFSEAVGVVQATDDAARRLDILTKRRGLISVDHGDVVALKVFE